MIKKNIRKYRKQCKDENDELCSMVSTCDDCYYYKKQLICSYCEREIPNKEFLNKDGCKWCQQYGVKNA